MTFRKGESGNPAGKPKGAKDKRTALRSLLETHADQLIKKAVELALDGDTTALRICFDRIIPALKARDTAVNLGKLEGTLADQGREVIAALADSRITPDEAATVMQAVSAQARIIEVDELEKRVKELERNATQI